MEVFIRTYIHACIKMKKSNEKSNQMTSILFPEDNDISEHEKY